MSQIRYAKIRVSLIALYSSRYPAIGETHALSVLGGVAKACLGENLEQLDIFDMVSVSQGNCDLLIDFLENSRPDILGISVGYGTFSFILKEYERIRAKVGDNCWIVLGGPLPTKMASDLVQKLPNIYVITGEGEYAFKELLLQRIKGLSLDPSNIPGIVYLRKNQISKTDRHLIDLDLSPNPYRKHIQSVLDGGGQIFCELSRGCSWSKCRFCLRGLTDFKGTREEYRRFPSNRLRDDLHSLSLLGVHNITFADEDFLGADIKDARSVVEIIEEIQKELPHPMNFDTSIMPSSIFTKSMSISETEERQSILRRLKECGLRKVFLGIESGADSQLQRYGKAHTAIEAAQAIATLRKISIHFEIGWIMFDPLSTVEELILNTQFIKDNNLVPSISYMFSELRLQPGTGYIKALNKIEKDVNFKIYNRKIDPDTLSFKYKFINQGVDQIVSETHIWRDKIGSLHYPLKNLSRFGKGSVLGENINIAWEILSDIRFGLFQGFESLLTTNDSDYTVKNDSRTMVLDSARAASNKIIQLICQLHEKSQRQPVVRSLKEAASKFCNN
ncbi:B12-binding domain-containing radical SAM protein [Desulfosarcina ovata]|uniref:Uncharacterized protein n=1 Tax=Desulfosarcina ovata subsp. ovata TaxID=2752305 RepID=A0A5K8AD50_9BACT|nr:radical SAM protein [Desulfosarcina ovata]BBO89860.1 hypothetical protein DSCOOX_30400 [Desulfosarcina ovata subsp. ovata]